MGVAMTINCLISVLATVIGVAASQNSSNLRGTAPLAISNATNDNPAPEEVVMSSTLPDGNRSVNTASWRNISALDEAPVRNVTIDAAASSNLSLQAASAQF